MTADPAKVALFDALADPTRLGVLDALARRPAPAGDLARALGVTPSRLSNHLARLKRDGLIDVTPHGRERVYRLRHPEIARFLKRAGALAALVEVAHERAGR